LTPSFEPIELIQFLIKETDQLQLLDEAALYGLRIRADMHIRHIFGESSKYLKELEDIYSGFLRPYVGFVDEDHIKRDREKKWLDGKLKMFRLFMTMSEELTLFSLPQRVATTETVEPSNRIFVVHGRDEAMKQSVARMLEQVGLEPIILHEKPSRGRTIIEKLTDYSDVGFAVVLLSPDDVAYPKNAFPNDEKSRARQNVVFELGFFIGRLGRERVVALYQEDELFEMPSDYSGVIYIPFDESASWRLVLVKELNACGYKVDANKLLT